MHKKIHFTNLQSYLLGIPPLLLYTHNTTQCFRNYFFSGTLWGRAM